VSIRVGVLGARGKTGRYVCAGVAGAPDLDLAAAIARSGVSDHVPAVTGGEPIAIRVSDRLEALTDARVDVAVDFTSPEAVVENARWCLDHGIHCVVGTSGITPGDLAALGERSRRTAGRANLIVAPNFSIALVLMERFAIMAAPHFPYIEIVEQHMETKRDAPSGTAVKMARALAAARAERGAVASTEVVPAARGADVDGVRIHAIRMPSLDGHHAIVLGREGETLTLVHDSFDPSPFVAGVLMAIRAVASRPGLTYGFEKLLEPTPGSASSRLG
jgi:4-hydroxy-tetrahydrodipicolinate reductase